GEQWGSYLLVPKFLYRPSFSFFIFHFSFFIFHFSFFISAPQSDPAICPKKRHLALKRRSNSAASACGFSARAMAALTAMRRAPAATAAGRVSRVIPPRTNAGTDVSATAWRTNSRPASSGKALVEEGNAGPTPR